MSSTPDTPNAPRSRSFAGREGSAFQLYRRFRLEMAQTFRGIASALYEFGADPTTGELSQTDFERVCTERLNLMSEEEAHLLFLHITNRDGGVGGSCTYRDFSVTDKEWERVVAQKQAQGGRSLNALAPRSPKRQFSMMRPSQKGAKPPWRQKQMPWEPSIHNQSTFVEAEAASKAKVALWEASRGRPAESTFRTKAEPEAYRCAELGATCRTQDRGRLTDPGLRETSCPPRRHEMFQGVAIATQADGWWPFSSPRAASSSLSLTPRRHGRLPQILAA